MELTATDAPFHGEASAPPVCRTRPLAAALCHIPMRQPVEWAQNGTSEPIDEFWNTTADIIGVASDPSAEKVDNYA